MNIIKHNVILFAIAIIGILLHTWLLHACAWQLPAKFIQQPAVITGTIDSIPIKKFHGYQFDFQVQTINHHNISTHVLIAWYHAPLLAVGQQWQLSVRLTPPTGLHNPGGFDYGAFLQHHGISATGYVQTRDDTNNKKIGEDKTQITAQMREKIHSVIIHVIHEQTIAALISALCVGIREGLTQSDWQVLQKTGTNHLVAIAGLHIGFAASMIYFCINRLWRCFSRLLLWMPATRAAEIAALAGALGYAALSGFAIPAQRASIMLLCFMLTKLLYQTISIWKRLLFAAMIILLINPECIFDASFWLSFYSVALLAWVMTGRVQSSHGIRSWITMQGTIVLSIFPLTLLFFQQASLIAFFTNAIAIPWIGFVILPLCLCACALLLFHLNFLGENILWLSGKLLLPFWKWLCVMAQLSFSSWHHAIIHPWILMASMTGILVLFAPRGLPHKWLGCVGVLPLLFSTPAAPHQREYWVSVIDVGQGLSVLVQTQHHVLLYDTGAHFPGGFDMGESVVAPYLRRQGISTIDRLEISHGDNDHSGGADAIVKNFSVKSIYTSAPTLIAHFHATACTVGQMWDWDGVHFTTLNPAKNTPYADNNSSCVLRISNGNSQLLLTGDIQRETEWVLADTDHNALHSTVLIVPHHGSRTSSSELFLSMVHPRYAVISAGKYNRYHLPSPSVVARYAADHIHLYNTANDGEISIRFFKDGHVILQTMLPPMMVSSH